MVNILHIFNEIKFSGAEMMYYTANTLFEQRGFRMIALATGTSKGEYASTFEAAGIKVIHMPMPLKKWDLIAFSQYFSDIRRLLTVENISLVHIHRSTYFVHFAACARIVGLPSIRTVHNVFKNRFLTWPLGVLRRLLARQLCGLIFQSIGESVEQNEKSYYRNPSVRVNNWYDSFKFFPATQQEKDILRKKLEINPTDFVLATAGSCSKIKNHLDIIHAIAEMCAENQLVFLHLGDGPEGQTEKSEVKKLNISNHVRFFGNVNNVREYLVASDVFVMTSRFEGLSIAGLEAMGCGLPLIFYNTPGLRDLVINEKNGLLTDPNPEDLKRALSIIVANEDLRLGMGEFSLKFAVRDFSINRGVDEIAALYEKQINRFKKTKTITE